MTNSYWNRGLVVALKDVRRVVDVALATVLLVPVLAVVVVFALAIWLVDGYRPFFLQVRLGRDEKPFTCWKLRTLPPSSSPLDLAYSDRVSSATRLGAWLRDRGIDELPQLVNILRGQMSFAGPRPLIEQNIERIEWLNQDLSTEVATWRKRRSTVRPGMVGWHQAHGAGPGLIWYDIEYVEDPSMRKHLVIFWRTMACFVLGRERFFRGRPGYQTALSYSGADQ